MLPAVSYAHIELGPGDFFRGIVLMGTLWNHDWIGIVYTLRAIQYRRITSGRSPGRHAVRRHNSPSPLSLDYPTNRTTRLPRPQIMISRICTAKLFRPFLHFSLLCVEQLQYPDVHITETNKSSRN